MRNLIRSALLSATALTAALSACHDDSHDDSHDDTPAMARYEITFNNLTAGQAMSPLALIAHDAAYQSFAPGQAASIALERLAEGGDNSVVLNEAKTDTIHVWQASSGAGLVQPGKTETLQLEIPVAQIASAHLTLLSMLANTNDAFAALNSAAIGTLQVGQSLSFDLPAYDAGTEAHRETADSMPGPAAAGGLREGFNPARDDLNNRISVHPSVLTKDDGLPTSVLTQLHRWDNPAARLSVRRLQ